MRGIMKQRILIRLLKQAGYRRCRSGDHMIFEKTGHRSVQVPNHKEINEYTAKQILKDAGLLPEDKEDYDG